LPGLVKIGGKRFLTEHVDVSFQSLYCGLGVYRIGCCDVKDIDPQIEQSVKTWERWDAVSPGKFVSFHALGINDSDDLYPRLLGENPCMHISHVPGTDYSDS